MRIAALASGSSGNCTLVSDGGTHILIDAGISALRIRGALALFGVQAGELDAVIITHAHSDHVSGLKTFAKSCTAPIYASAVTAMQLDLPPETRERLFTVREGAPFCVGGLEVLAFRAPHDSGGCIGLRITGSACFGLATDMGCVTEEIAAGLRGCDGVLLEANHDTDMLMNGPYPYPLKRRILSEEGHLSNAECAALAADLARSGTRRFILGHLSRENNTPALAIKCVREALPDTAFVAAANPDAPLCLELTRSALCSE